MSEKDYWIIWACYIGSSLVFILMWWIFTQPLKSAWLKVFLRMPTFALLLSPIRIPEYDFVLDKVYAPAIAVFAIDFIGGYSQKTFKTLPYLMAMVSTAWIVGFLYIYTFSSPKKSD